ncbi:MAG: cell division protein FtsZ [Endomicrobia bacterium]|nr:cell division protein FtsZ [Endomicrobiia bacterium]
MKSVDKNPVRIKIIGVGGGGGNTVNRIISAGQIGEVEIISMNTDMQVLKGSLAPIVIQIGQKTTNGQGSGGNPEIGKKAAEESSETIRALLTNTDLLFLTCGMGKGTGTGATPVVARIAKEMGILTVSVVTKPFKYEGNERMRIAEAGIAELKKYVDALLVIPNQKFLELYPHLSFNEMLYRIADDVLYKAVLSMWKVVTKPGYMNVDFADARNVLKDAGEIIMSVGSESSDTENCLKKALKAAMNNPFIDVNIQGAKRLLINICGANIITNDVIILGDYLLENVVNKDSTTIFIGYVNSEEYKEKVEVTIIASGFSNLIKKNPRAKKEHKVGHTLNKTEKVENKEILGMIRKGVLRVLK